MKFSTICILIASVFSLVQANTGDLTLLDLAHTDASFEHIDIDAYDNPLVEIFNRCGNHTLCNAIGGEHKLRNLEFDFEDVRDCCESEDDCGLYWADYARLRKAGIDINLVLLKTDDQVKLAKNIFMTTFNPKLKRYDSDVTCGSKWQTQSKSGVVKMSLQTLTVVVVLSMCFQ